MHKNPNATIAQLKKREYMRTYRAARIAREPGYRETSNVRMAKYFRERRERDPVGEWARTVHGSLRNRSKRNGIAENLSALILQKLAVESCPVLGCGVALWYGGKTTRGARPDSASVDRILSEKGYVLGNVQVMCYRCNTLKSNGKPEQFEWFAAQMREAMK